MPHNAQCCGRCSRLAFDPAEKLSAHSFGRCALMAKWVFMSMYAACAFQPARFQAAAR